MKFKNIRLIINPASAKEEPILSLLSHAFINTGVNWEVSVIKPKIKAGAIAADFVGKADLIVVYGGDGSVTEVAQALVGAITPMAIIPAGTANVMSKELGIPQDSKEAIQLITGDAAKIINIDMGLVNRKPFMLRVNFGIMADMILNTKLELKSSFGQLAYGITAMQTLSAAKPITFKMHIDGKRVIDEGVSLTVNNAGNIGIGNFTFLPDITVSDGYLDVILMNDTDLLSVLRVAGSTIMQTQSDVLKHWRCKKIKIELVEPLNYLCDDSGKSARVINIGVLPKALKVLVPITN